MIKEETYQVGNNICFKVKKDENGKKDKIISIKDEYSGREAERGGDIKNLNIKLKINGKVATVTAIGDNSTFETHASPGCAWYIFDNEYYYICSS